LLIAQLIELQRPNETGMGIEKPCVNRFVAARV